MLPDAGDVELLRARARQLAELAREEDWGQRGDVTSALLVEAGGEGAYRIRARQAGVFAGHLIAGDILSVFDRRIELNWSCELVDGAKMNSGTVLGELTGPRPNVLAVERVLLNFLQRLCGVATATRAFVDAIEGTGAKIYDTRKTLPGWRLLDKYAVRCGGGRNHRIGLHDAVLIKDNHLDGVADDQLASQVFKLLNTASELDPPPAFIEVEADRFEQIEPILSVVGIDVLLLDNFELDEMARAVELRDSLGLKGKVQLEASGGVTLESVARIARTGVERISVGAITHSAPAIDLALDAL